MLLSQYLGTLQSLIQSPSSPIPLVTTALLTQYINLGRAQVAIDAECVRSNATAAIVAGVSELAISQLAVQITGASQAIVVRNARINGSDRVDMRPWDWFENYYLNGPPAVPVTAESVMSHQGQGSFATLWIYAQQTGNLSADVVLLPDNLASDSDPDVVPYPWTDAVPFWAAFYAYMAMQRQADANVFLMRYYEMTRRGRSGVTSTMLPDNDPGGVGARLANLRSTLGAPQAAPQGARQQGGG